MPRSCWPTPEQELLLKAALRTPDEAVSAWRQWRAEVDVTQTDEGSYRLYPLVFRNLTALQVQDPRMEILRRAYRRTWTRNNVLFHSMEPLIRSLIDRGVPVMLLKGAALAQAYYRHLGLRPMEDVDLMVPFDRVRDAISLLRANGYQTKYPTTAQRITHTHSMAFESSNGPPLDLHWFLIEECCEEEAQPFFWNAAVPFRFAGQAVSSLCASDHLFHALAHGVRWSLTPPIRWIADAAIILRESAIDWERLLAAAAICRVNLMVSEALAYLDRFLPGAVPGRVLQALRNTPTCRWEQAEFRVKTKPQTHWRRLLFHWFNYRRLSRNPRPGGAVRFPRYLLERWGIESFWQVPDVVKRASPRR
jgi:Uncharacterised nucleotidyltransferase